MWLTPEGAAAEVRDQESVRGAQSSQICELYMSDFTVQELLNMNNETNSCRINEKGSFSQPGSSGTEGPSSSSVVQEEQLGQVVRKIAERERPSGECKEYKSFIYSYHLSRLHHIPKTKETGQGYVGFYQLKSQEYPRVTEGRGVRESQYVPSQRYELAEGTVGLLIR